MSLTGLTAALRAEGGTIARLTGEPAAGAQAEYEVLIEMIREGTLLHYGPQRVVRTDDEDLALLAGDRLFALGLARLAALGDLEAVVALGDLIAAVARAHAAGDRGAAEEAWAQSARRIGRYKLSAPSKAGPAEDRHPVDSAPGFKSP